MGKKQVFVSSLVFLFLITALTYAQEIEILDGVRVVHNEKGGKWVKCFEIRIGFAV